MIIWYEFDCHNHIYGYLYQWNEMKYIFLLSYYRIPNSVTEIDKLNANINRFCSEMKLNFNQGEAINTEKTKTIATFVQKKKKKKKQNK